MAGTLYLVPNALGDGPLDDVLPARTLAVAARLSYYVGENAKSTRAFLKRVGAVTPLASPLQAVEIAELRVDTPADRLPALIAPIAAGRDGGLVSEAGCPAIADPGAGLVRLAHRTGIAVRPLVGPSSILLAVMAAGLDGQRFAFNGYLPTDAAARRTAIRDAEHRSRELAQTQAFIETPYRNDAVFRALVETCRGDTWIGVARELTGDGERIATYAARDWRTRTIELDRKPTVFTLLADAGAPTGPAGRR